jgi:hypothetical protein
VGIGVSIGLARQLASTEAQASPAQAVLTPQDS